MFSDVIFKHKYFDIFTSKIYLPVQYIWPMMPYKFITWIIVTKFIACLVGWYSDSNIHNCILYFSHVSLLLQTYLRDNITSKSKLVCSSKLELKIGCILQLWLPLPLPWINFQYQSNRMQNFKNLIILPLCDTFPVVYSFVTYY